jgi:hypothetical protein
MLVLAALAVAPVAIFCVVYLAPIIATMLQLLGVGPN